MGLYSLPPQYYIFLFAVAASCLGLMTVEKKSTQRKIRLRIKKGESNSYKKKLNTPQSQGNLLTSLLKLRSRSSLKRSVLGAKNLNRKPWNIPWRKKSHKKRNRSSAYSKRVWHPFSLLPTAAKFYQRTDLLCSMEGRLVSWLK